MKLHTQAPLLKQEEVRKFPEGFLFLPDFISKDEERELLEGISGIELSNVEMRGVVAKRRMAQFGLRYRYATKQISKAPPIPDFLLPPRERCAERLGLSPEDLPQAIINEYTIGTPIGWHIDGPVYDIIAGFSIAGDCTFKLRPSESASQGSLKSGAHGKALSFLQPARSAYVMQGEARWHWQHSISPTKALRYSVTYRSLKK
jgi:alkylated DNA repair protein (DNA oxidative demethylase)